MCFKNNFLKNKKYIILIYLQTNKTLKNITITFPSQQPCNCFCFLSRNIPQSTRMDLVHVILRKIRFRHASRHLINMQLRID